MGSIAIRLAIIDDHPGLIRGTIVEVRERLAHLHDDVVTGGTIDVLAELTPTDVDVVVLDLSLGDGSDPVDNVAQLVGRAFAVLLYTQDTRRGLIARCFRAGAQGIVPKHADSDLLAEAITVIAGGQAYLSPQWAEAVESDTEWGVPNLAPRELQALKLYAVGLPMKSVGRRLDVSIDTAKEYLDRVRRKYAEHGREASTKSDLYFRAVEDGYLPPAPPPPWA